MNGGSVSGYSYREMVTMNGGRGQVLLKGERYERGGGGERVSGYRYRENGYTEGRVARVGGRVLPLG